jgi:hypothetical protein
VAGLATFHCEATLRYRLFAAGDRFVTDMPDQTEKGRHGQQFFIQGGDAN